jgi:saposin
LDAVLKNNKSDAAVEEALSKVCTILPRKERTDCDEFVKNYGPVLADLISELADPKLVCRYLGMCQVVSPQEIKPITYSNHRYARIPV